MTGHRFTDAADLAGTRITRDGYLAAEVRCARTGCQTYLGTELGLLDAEPVTVYRPPEVVFAKDSLATFAGKPVTVDHPAEPVTADSWKQHAVGEIGDEVARDGETVRVGIMVRDAAAIAAIRDGKRQISMGYSTPIKMQDGIAPDGTPYQAVQAGPITINHLALVDAARGGAALRIGDHDDAGKDRAAWGATPISHADRKGDIMPDTLQPVVVGDKAVQVSAVDAAILDAFKAQAEKALADAKAEHDKAIAAKDAEIEKLQGKLDAANEKVLDDAALDKRVADRADLIGKAKTITKDVDTAGLSDAAIRKAVVAAKLGDAAIKDKSDAYIEARFDVLAEDAAKGDPVADVLASGTTTKDADLTVADKAYAENIAYLQNAHRTAPEKKEA